MVELLLCKTYFTVTYYSTAVVLVLERDRQEQVLGNVVVVWHSECQQVLCMMHSHMLLLQELGVQALSWLQNKN